MASQLNRFPKINQSHLPDTTAAVVMYNQEGGNLSDGARFGHDPLSGHSNKMSIRHQAFTERYPSFEDIFHQLVNSNSTLFKEALVLFGCHIPFIQFYSVKAMILYLYLIIIDMH